MRWTTWRMIARSLLLVNDEAPLSRLFLRLRRWLLEVRWQVEETRGDEVSLASFEDTDSTIGRGWDRVRVGCTKLGSCIPTDIIVHPLTYLSTLSMFISPSQLYISVHLTYTTRINSYQVQIYLYCKLRMEKRIMLGLRTDGLVILSYILQYLYLHTNQPLTIIVNRSSFAQSGQGSDRSDRSDR